MTCSDLTTNVMIQPANAAFSNAILRAPTYNCYGSVCDSASNSTLAGNASSSAVAGSQNRIVVIQLFYNWQTMASLFESVVAHFKEHEADVKRGLTR